MSKPYYILYETRNLINNKYYRGIHITKSLTDNYLGSGSVLKKAISKYGKENFERKIISLCSSKKELLDEEKKFVDFEDPDSYNQVPGGGGCSCYGKFGKDHPKFGKKETEKANKSRSKKLKGNIPWNKGKKYPRTKQHQNVLTNSIAKKWEIVCPDGLIISVHNLAKFCRENGLSQGNLQTRKKSKNYKLVGKNV